MKKIVFFSFITILLSNHLISQAPNLMSYQAVIWDGSGNLVAKKMVSIKLSILQGSVNGTSVYSETHRVQTNVNGLASLMIGGGTNATGKILDINWGGGIYFLKTETDPNGGVNFSITGITQLVSVPYSLASNNSDLANNLNTPLPGLKGQILSVDKDGKPIWVSTIPTVSTTNYSTILADSVKGGGNVMSDGGSPVTARGVVWSTSPNPTISLSTKTIDGSGLGTFSSIISGLTSITDSTSFYVRAYATNINGTAYGEEISVIVFNKLPKINWYVSSYDCYNITARTNIYSVSPIISKGIVWSNRPNPTVLLLTKTNEGSGLESFTSSIKDTKPFDTIYIRSYATNSYGTSYGYEQMIVPFGRPNVKTNTSNIAYTTIISGGNIHNDGFFWCGVSARGVVWSQSEIPTISLSTKTVNGSGFGSFTSYILNLKPTTTYYVRSYATFGDTTLYGNVDTVRTRTWINCPGILNDIDNNVYNVVTIGYQCWTKENLKVSRYRNGESIPIITSGKSWESLTSGNRCWYANDSIKYEEPFGNLYNWYAVSDSRGLCPNGWHVPRDDEWHTLIDFLGGNTVAGGKIKSLGTSYWNFPQEGTTNESGFSAFPGGTRMQAGDFVNIKSMAAFWSSTEWFMDSRYIWVLSVYSGGLNTYMSYGGNKNDGRSVRCIRD